MLFSTGSMFVGAPESYGVLIFIISGILFLVGLRVLTRGEKKAAVLEELPSETDEKLLASTTSMQPMLESTEALTKRVTKKEFVLSRIRDGVMQVRTLAAELETNFRDGKGFIQHYNYVRVILNRLQSEGKIVRINDGNYIPKPKSRYNLINSFLKSGVCSIPQMAQVSAKVFPSVAKLSKTQQKKAVFRTIARILRQDRYSGRSMQIKF